MTLMIATCSGAPPSSAAVVPRPALSYPNVQLSQAPLLVSICLVLDGVARLDPSHQPNSIVWQTHSSKPGQDIAVQIHLCTIIVRGS